MSALETMNHAGLIEALGVEQYLNLLCLHTYLEFEPLELAPDAITGVNWELFVQVIDENRTWTMMPEAIPQFADQYGIAIPVSDSQLAQWENQIATAKMRNIVAHDELMGIANLLQQNDIRYVAMKGAATGLAERLWPRIGDRFLGDIDLLVDPSQIRAAGAVLQEAGYEFESDPDQSHSEHQLPTLVHPKRMLPVELHFEVCLRTWADRLPVDSVLANAREVTMKDALVRVPSREHQKSHCLLHASLFAINDHRRFFPIVDLLELKLLDRAQRASEDSRDSEPEPQPGLFLVQLFERVSTDYDPRLRQQRPPTGLRKTLIECSIALKRRLLWRSGERGRRATIFNWLAYKAFALLVRGPLRRNEFD